MPKKPKKKSSSGPGVALPGGPVDRNSCTSEWFLKLRTSLERLIAIEKKHLRDAKEVKRLRSEVHKLTK